jgi:hypothetical protein
MLEKMIATQIKRYEWNGFVMPKPIASDAENERYTAALLELESRSRLTAEEKHFAESITPSVPPPPSKSSLP